MRKTLLGVAIFSMVFTLAITKVSFATEYGWNATQVVVTNNGVITQGSEIVQDREAISEKEQLASMKKQIIPQVEKAIANLKAQKKTFNGKGMPTPQGLDESLAELDKYLADIKAATTTEQLEKFFNSFPDLIDKIKLQMQEMAKGVDLLATLKQAESLIAKLQAQAKSLRAKAIRMGLEDDIDELLRGLDVAILDLKTRLTILVAKVKADPSNSVVEVSAFFDYIRNVFDVNATGISYGLDLKNAIKTKIPQLISAVEKKLAAAKKDEKFMARLPELLSMIVDIKAKYAEVKVLAEAKPIDTLLIINKLDELTDLSVKFLDILEGLTGKEANPYLPKPMTTLMSSQNYTKVNLPTIRVIKEYIIYKP